MMGELKEEKDPLQPSPPPSERLNVGISGREATKGERKSWFSWFGT